MKQCKRCFENKILDEFHNNKNRKDNKEIYCKSCLNKSAKDRYKKDPRISYHKEYRLNNKTKLNKQINEWYVRNKEKHIKHTSKSKFIRKKTDVNFKLSELIRSYIYSSLNKFDINKIEKIKYLACDIGFYKTYLEQQFKPEMNWSNFGKIWEIDHIIPISKFDLTIEENIYKAFNYLNTQPLFKTTEIAESLGYKNYIGNRNKGKN